MVRALNPTPDSAPRLTQFRLINLVTAGGLINYIVMTTTFIFFYNACKAQGLDRRSLPYTGWFQPYSAYIAVTFLSIVVCCYGYSVYRPGGWDTGTWFSFYTMLVIAPINFLVWKLVKKTKFVKAAECDLQWELPAIQRHEDDCEGDAPMFSLRETVRKLTRRR